MAQSEDTVPTKVAGPEGLDGVVAKDDENEGDDARAKSLQLGGGGGLPIGATLGKYVAFLCEFR